MTKLPPEIPAEVILNQTSDGIYVTDRSCRILFWNDTAAQITGYSAEEVVERACSEDILVHQDQNGNQLCIKGRCPLHRAMTEDKASDASLMVFAKHKDGRRVPVTVSVAPLKNQKGEVIGGIEVFRDDSVRQQDMQRSRRIQEHNLPQSLPHGPIGFSALYRPHGELGGDYYQVRELGGGRFAFILADVVGHGVSAALYTMVLNALWHQYAQLAGHPERLMTVLNQEMEARFMGDSYLTAIMGVADSPQNSLTYVTAGHPPGVIRKADGKLQILKAQNLALGMLPGVEYEESEARFESGDLALLYSDCVLDTKNPQGESFGFRRLTGLIADFEPGTPAKLLDHIANALLDFVESVRLDDDLTLLVISNPGAATG